MNDNRNLHDEMDAALSAMRTSAKERSAADGTPPPADEMWLPKEIPVKRSAWVLRGIMLLLVLVTGIEAYFMFSHRAELDELRYEEIPAEVYADPADIPLPTPTAEIYVEPTPEEAVAPEPTLIPLPEGVGEAPFPPQ